jgi:hypothetical protein
MSSWQMENRTRILPPLDLASYQVFFVACVGASASFIGLLFVALSVVLGNKDADVELEFTDRRLAESSFTALAIIFFISLDALTPDTNIGYVTLITAFIGLRSSWQLFQRFRETRSKGGVISYQKGDVFWFIVSLFIYIAQGICGILIIRNPLDTTYLDYLSGILLWLFGMGLVRSWALTGIRSKKS